jgi:integrase
VAPPAICFPGRATRAIRCRALDARSSTSADQYDSEIKISQVGRHRKDGNPLALEPRVYWHHGQFIYRHRDGSAEQLGTDVGRANERAKIYNDPENRFGTIGYFLDLYIAEAKAGRLHKKKAPRTIRDNEIEAKFLKAAFERNAPADLVREPNLIADYRDKRPDARGRGKIRANRELSLLSSLYRWLIEKGHCPGLNMNPVLLIRRNPQPPKERYVEDAEVQAVYQIAQRSLCMALELTYRTLQRPEDVLLLQPSSVRAKTVSGASTRVLSVPQGKTGRTVDIEISPDIDAALAMLSGGKVQRLSEHLVHNLRGRKYTVDGIGAMIRKLCVLAGMKSFGLMDMRAKGATDMYLAGVPLERIQMLMGHKSVMTTEIYVKRLLSTIRIAQPNRQQMAF